MLQDIVPQSAGSLAVAILGFMMAILQVLIRLKSPYFKWVGWSAAISFSGMIYAAGIFLEYNTPPGDLNRFAGILEFAALICLIHSWYGLTFSYFNLDGRRYHLGAGLFHGLLLIVLFTTDLFVADYFVALDFKWLSKPYKEAALGPLGSVFELYIAFSSIAAWIFWIRYKGPDPGYRSAYIAGIGCWILIGLHDSLASLGVPSAQYFMEYGFFGFSAVILWVIFSTSIDVLAENKYRVITEYTNDGILVLQDNRVVFENPAVRGLTGRNILNAKSEDLFEMLVPEDRPVLSEHYRHLLDGGTFPDGYMAHLNNRDNGGRVVDIRASKIRYRNKPAVLGIVRDVTERVREEEALKESTDKIFRLKKMESLGLLAGGVAHDLNNVLSGIINYPELILMNLPEDSSLRKPVEAIKKSGQKAVAIVQDLLTMARGVAIERKPIDLNAAIRSYLKSPEYMKLLQFHPNITVDTGLDDNLFSIKGSMVHIGKVVMNLVSNASEAIKGKGAVHISTENRYLDTPLNGYENVKAGDYVVLVVSDDGPGIPPDDLGKIFEPFFTKKTMGRSGTGIGLTLVWNVMQDHDGYINVSSDEKGTTFEMYFPVTRELSLKQAASLPLENLFGKGESVLVVDDVESQRDISCQMLETLKYRPTAVSSGEEAVAYLKTNRADLLVLDMIMDPGIGGYETYRRIAKIYPGQKAIIVSGFSETKEVRKTQKLGAGRYLKKPILLEELGVAAKEVLSGDNNPR
jgi:PAS domain S-box-containing protein